MRHPNTAPHVRPGHLGTPSKGGGVGSPGGPASRPEPWLSCALAAAGPGPGPRLAKWQCTWGLGVDGKGSERWVSTSGPLRESSR